MAQFNPDDPRFQREMQRAAANMGPARLARATTGEISGRHAGYQLGRQQQFRGLALSSELAKQQHAQALARASQFDKSFGLATRRQGFRESEFATNLGREKSGLNQTMLMGLLGTGLSVMEGRRREKIMQSQIAEQNYMTGIVEDYINKVNGGARLPFGLSGGTVGEGR
jgi:hypothetical protein